VLARCRTLRSRSGRTRLRWWTPLLPAVQRGRRRASARPCPVAGVRSAGAGRLPVSGRPPPVSARPDSRYPPAASTWAHVTSADEQAQPARRCRGAGTAAAGGPPPSCRSRPGSRTPRPLSGVAAEPDTADAVAVRCFRNRGRCPDGWCPPRTLPQPAGVRGYKNRSSGRRPLDGCRHRRYARASWRPSRLPSWART
jgi:hypothetical protein